jgi:hypothetical protein
MPAVPCACVGCVCMCVYGDGGGVCVCVCVSVCRVDQTADVSIDCYENNCEISTIVKQSIRK